jgi:gluconokinase
LSLPGLTFTGITEYLREQLLGAPVISVSMASGSGMLDVDSAGWHDEALELAGVTAAQLPEVSDAPGRLRPEFARRWPALADADWMPATGDGATSTIGAGCTPGTSAGVTVGTSAAIRVVHSAEDAPPLDASLWRYRVDGTRMLTGAAVSSGGVLHGWLEGLFGDVDDPASPPGAASAGLSVVPMHAGSRPPVVLPAGSGVVAGLSLATRPVELIAATYEGVAFELLRSLRLLDASFGSTLSVVLGGGAVAASPWWRRAFAAAFDRDVRYQPDPEVGARGAAMLALGVSPVPPDTRLPTVPDEVAAMQTAGARYEDVRARLVLNR